MAFLDKAAEQYGAIKAEEFSQSTYMRCLARHQSPIEDLFWIALSTMLAAERIELNPAFEEDWHPDGSPVYTGNVCCRPQEKIGKYVVDFLLTYDIENQSEVVVELDGHDFHDKDKYQRAYEKARDRFLVREGYRVLHFTGSEVVKDPYKVAYEVLATLGVFYPDRAPYDPNCPLGEIYA